MTKRFCDHRDWKEIGKVPKPDEALKSGDYQAALNGFAMEHLLAFRESRTMTSDDSMIGFGATLWLLGDLYGAALIWARVCDETIKGRYTHSSNGTFKGGLLLWFASVWLKKGDWQKKPDFLVDNLHDLADTHLEKLLSKKRSVMGVGIAASIARHLRGEMDFGKVEAEYSDVSLFRERQQTMALFYAGVRAYEQGNRKETLRFWSQVSEPKNSLVEIEYYLLIAERNRLSGS